MRVVRLSCAVLLTVGAIGLNSPLSSASDTYYRWKDDRGNPVHSDRPPPEGVDYEVVSTSSSMIRRVDAEEGVVPLELQPRPGNEFEQVNTRAPMVEKNPEFCERARENLQILETKARVSIRNEQGEKHFLSAEEKAEQKQAALDTIAEHCD